MCTIIKKNKNASKIVNSINENKVGSIEGLINMSRSWNADFQCTQGSFTCKSGARSCSYPHFYAVKS